MLILILTIFFWNANPEVIFGQILAEKVKAVCLPENWHIRTYTQYLEDIDSYFDISFLKFQT